MKLSVVLALVGLIAYVNADLYMQVPSGSNNRLNEANTNRDNNNRLFDSQNNAKGGYCFGPSMSYYERSLLTVEWTSQHGCGSDKQECNIVLQYMCSQYNNPAEDFPEDQVRDGGTTQTPTTDKATQATAQENTVDGMGFQYGQHENYYWYTWCRARDRNHGLYTADRNVNNNAGASATRQNNNGGRSGLECAEERDYYPYWHPSPWKDIAILVDDESLCGYFKDESQNVKAKGYCYDPAAENSDIAFNWAKYNNPIDCQKNSLTWAEWPSWGISAPECVKNVFTRDNHLGNTANGFNAHYNWTLPTSGQEPCIADDNCNCVLRIRYNISTIDFSGYKVPFADSTNNDGAAFLEQDPDLPVLREDCVNGVEAGQPCNVTLAIDTSQFARTFQDRSYVFHIKSRPKGVSDSARVFNLNVKGKRGNIVQAYPSTEYDFHPHQLEVRVGDYIHFQWTGCDTNPAGNAGEGTAGTDRSNMVQIESIGQSVPASLSFLKGGSLFESEYLRNRMAFLDQSNCKSYEELNANGNNADQDKDNCQNLNKADPYFDGGLVKMNKTGTFYYMSSRNNNFTNRGQKGTLSVSAILPTWGIAIVSVGAALFVASMGAGAAMFYAKTHPHSAIANALGKL